MIQKGIKICFLLFFIGCTPDSYSDGLTQLLPDNPYDWHDIVISENQIYAVGGDNWQVASIAQISPGNFEIWTSTEDLGSLYTTVVCEENILCYGLYGSAAAIDLQRDTIMFPRLPYWKNIKTIVKLSDNKLIMASGLHNEPRMLAISDCSSWWDVQPESESEEPPIQDMIVLEDDKILACGHGFISISNNVDKMWDLLPPTDADFIDMTRQEEYVYILSRKGQVLSYDINSSSFSTLKKSSSRHSGARYFSTIEVDDAGRIYIGAEEGNIMYKDEEWHHFKLPTDYQVNAIKTTPEKVIIAGNSGMFMSIERP